MKPHAPTSGKNVPLAPDQAMPITQPELRQLLSRYPDLSNDERNRVVMLMNKAPRLEVGLLSSDPALGEKYYAFKAAEKRRMAPTAWDTAKFLAFYLLPTVVIIWAVARVA